MLAFTLERSESDGQNVHENMDDGDGSTAHVRFDYWRLPVSGRNRSPFSDPVPVTTQPFKPKDITPPTPPSNLREAHDNGSDTEIHLWWTQSTDDSVPQANIRYDVYVNGNLQDIQFGSGMSIVYGRQGENLIKVTATDTAGNTSAPATIVVILGS